MDENIIPINMQQEIANEVVDTLNEDAIIETQNILKPTVEEVKASAAEVLKYAIYLQAKYNNTLRIGQNIGITHDELVDLKNFQSKMVQNEKDYENLMSRVLILQNMTNAFLGTEVKIAFVSISSNGTVKIFELENTMDHWGVSRSSSKRGGALAARIKAGAAKSHGEQLMKTLPHLDATFKEVYQRSIISKKRINMNGAFYIFWKEGKIWERYKVTSKGTLGESYFAFFINEFDNFSNFIEAAVGLFMTHNPYGVQFVDNAPGFLKGDVRYGNTEYAVKASGASAMGYMQIIQDYAKEIYETTNLEEYLNGLKKDLDGVANQAKKQVKSEIGDVDQKILADLRRRRQKLGAEFKLAF